MIAVVDYAKGNLRSVQKGLEVAGASDVRVVTDPADIARAQAVVLPGVGAFADASASMQVSGQMDAVRDAIVASTPFLGICLGLHLLFEAGAEHAQNGDALPPGLGILPGVCDRMPSQDAAGAFFKVPHVGWNSVEKLPGCDTPLLEGIPEGEHFYFTHSYTAPDSAYTQATTTHSITFPCFVDYNHTCFGIQFHPEKSSDAGLAVLRNFVNLIG
ncbi:MAG: imidazole glycerol phosphate synthase subunit HisH [Eggerthellaceae bacterium]|nr:imidazole glycerol phosphate synthase subunit HisH [Eggerthellaceae bacterium]